jgi:hypothetical protein
MAAVIGRIRHRAACKAMACGQPWRDKDRPDASPSTPVSMPCMAKTCPPAIDGLKTEAVAALFDMGLYRHRKRVQTGEKRGPFMIRMLVGFLLGLVAGGAVTMALGILAGDVFDISQREGAYAMAVAFVYTPIGAVVGGIIGAVLARRRR